MIVVTVDLTWMPAGAKASSNPIHKSRLAELHIINVGGTIETCDYEIEVVDPASGGRLIPKEFVKGHDRSLHPLVLVKKAIEVVEASLATISRSEGR